MKPLLRPVIHATAMCALLACGGDDATPAADTGTTDTGVTDTGVTDAGADTTDATSGSDTSTDVTPIACGTDSPAALGACVETDRYIADLEAVAIERATGTQGAADVRAYIVTALTELGMTIEIDESVGQGANIIGTLPGTGGSDELVVISAHYDGTPGCAGADDNATGVAGLLETARVLSQTEHSRTIVFAFWDEEERGYVGSWRWTDAAVEANTPVVIHLVYEMIGYATDEPNTQELPLGFDLVFPDVAAQMADNENRGDFIALISNDGGSPYVDTFADYATGVNLPALGMVLEGGMATSDLTGDLRRSDHQSSWAVGYPAIMITDTSEFRYPGYHCGDGEDSVDRLDHAFASQTVAATIYTAAIAASANAPAAAATPTMLRDCDPVSNDGCADGEKCATVAQATGWTAFECVPLEGEAATGESCGRPDGISGVDTCDVGNYCAFWGLPYSDVPNRQCFASCVSNAECGDGRACITYNPSHPRHGVCVDTCSPFDEDSCGADLHCTAERVDSDGRLAWACNRIRTFAEGDRCTPGIDNCAEGLSCGYSTADGVARCGAPCDDANPCPEGRTCQTMSNASLEFPTAGVCQ